MFKRDYFLTAIKMMYSVFHFEARLNILQTPSGSNIISHGFQPVVNDGGKISVLAVFLPFKAKKVTKHKCEAYLVDPLGGLKNCCHRKACLLIYSSEVDLAVALQR